MNVTTKNGIRVIYRDEVDCYRATSHKPFNTIIYMKTGEDILCYETFEQIDCAIDL